MHADTYHDYISRSNADLIVAASIKWIKRSVVNHLHWLLLELRGLRWRLAEATDRDLLIKQTWSWSLLCCGSTKKLSIQTEILKKVSCS